MENGDVMGHSVTNEKGERVKQTKKSLYLQGIQNLT